MTEENDAAADAWTVQRILEWTTSFLAEKGVENSRLEAELLLAHARGCQRINLYTDLNVVLTDSERAQMRGFVKRRATREPLAYITGHREFYGRDFQIQPGVLVPRPETETLIDVALENIPKGTRQKICEIGFGSGCIAITLAKQRPEIVVVATDISPTALECASANVEKHGLNNRVTLHSGSLFTPLDTMDGDELFHGIVSNPPYIRSDEMNGLQPEVAQHEPHEALVAGHDGLDVVRGLIEEAPNWLQPHGWLALEVDPSQCVAVSELLIEHGFSNTSIHKDLSGDDRIVLGCR